jgi:hypothetical protein
VWLVFFWGELVALFLNNFINFLLGKDLIWSKGFSLGGSKKLDLLSVEEFFVFNSGGIQKLIE